MRLSGPGPGAYEVPNTFGRDPRRRCAIGSRSRGPRIQPSPGPSDYAPVTPSRRRGSSWSFRGSSRPKTGGVLAPPTAQDVPGPGAYDPIDPVSANANAGSRFGAADVWRPKTTPGPGDYDPAIWQGSQEARRAPTPFGVRAAEYPGAPMLPACDSPGPAYYDIVSPGRTAILTEAERVPAHGFTTAPRFVTQAAGFQFFQAPGPGTYAPERCTYQEGIGGGSPKTSLTPRRWYNSHLNPRETPRLLQP